MLSEFITQIKSKGLARSNRFSVMMALPPVLNGGANPAYDLRNILLLAENVQLPGVNLNTIQNRTFGEYRETPYELVYDNINLNFYVDREMQVKKLFDKWILGINGYGGVMSGTGTRLFKYYNDYITNLQIYVYDTQEKSYYGVNLYEAYPKTVGAVTLDNNSKEVMKLAVTMQYKYWRPVNLVNGDPQIPVDMSQDDYMRWVGMIAMDGANPTGYQGIDSVVGRLQ